MFSGTPCSGIELVIYIENAQCISVAPGGIRLQKTGWFAIVVIVLLLQGLIPACSMNRVIKRQASMSKKHAGCMTCHRTADPAASGDSSSFAGGIDPSTACLDCHHYTVNHHPVDISPATASTGTLPLFNGQIRCLTCHQAHTDAAQNMLREPPNLLRRGSNSDRKATCFLCHAKEQYQKIDPHVMLALDGSIKQVNGQPVCLLCHTEKPDTNGDPRDVQFRADVAFLCWRCHSTMSGSFMEKHHHVKIKKATRERIAETEEETGIDLPLARDGMITCSTCHNPHEQGVITRQAAAAGSTSERRLRLPKENICSACHDL